MSTIDAGGYAFPQPAIYDMSREQVNQASAYGCDSGITVRDYFAAKAMPLVPPQPAYNMKPNESNADYIARHAYAFADAMLKARQS